jgi:hypothetical protein
MLCALCESSTVTPASDSDVAGFFGPGCSAVQELAVRKAVWVIAETQRSLNRVIEHTPRLARNIKLWREMKSR